MTLVGGGETAGSTGSPTPRIGASGKKRSSVAEGGVRNVLRLQPLGPPGLADEHGLGDELALGRLDEVGVVDLKEQDGEDRHEQHEGVDAEQ